MSKFVISNFFKKLQVEPLATKSDRRLNDSLAILGVASALYDDVTGWPKLALALNQALLGDGSLLLKLSDDYVGRSQTGKYSTNENDIAPIISCLDWNTSVETTSKINIFQKFKIVGPIFGPYLANSEFVCKHLFQSIVNKNSNIYLALSSTVMIIGTTRDPATPYEWAVALSKSFPNSFLVTLDSDGHTGQGRSNPCIDGAVDSYLIDFHGSSRAITCTSFGK